VLAARSNVECVEQPRPSGLRLALIAPAGIAMLLGLYAGLLLIGVPLPALTARLAEVHAPLLVFGFVGGLISLERAVALRAGWAYAAPVLLVLGALVTLTPAPRAVGPILVLLGMLVHLGQYLAIWRRQPMTATSVQALGVVAGAAAALVWCAGVSVAHLVPLLAAFLILTIAGERLELARVAIRGILPERLLFAVSLGLLVAALLALTAPAAAVPIAGALLLALVAWLVTYDIARVTVRRAGLPRYVAVCLLTGYGWLLVAGAGWLIGGPQTAGALYDATTHAVFLGFVMTMIMAHAPLILPAVLQLQIPYHPALYVPVGLLHLGLVVRLLVGDAWGVVAALPIGGAVSAAAIVLFAVTAATLAIRARRGAAVRPVPDEEPADVPA